MMKCIRIVVFVCIIFTKNTNADVVLFKKGSYNVQKHGDNIAVTNVRSISNTYFMDVSYLKINARITELPFGAVKDFNSLELLKLVSCSIVNIHPGAFSNLPRLSILALNDNRIKTIQTGVFNNLNISTLFLHRNKIESIETTAFDGLPNLTKIKLNSNLLVYWDSNWFKNTPQLSELFFRRNAFRTIPEKAFRHFKDNVSNKNLSIYLSKNYISSIDPKAFVGLKDCSQIWLDRNEIKELDTNLFVEMEHLEVLYLAKNLLMDLPSNLFKNIKSSLLSLDLTSNNLSCINFELVNKVKLTILHRNRYLDCKCIKNLNKKLTQNGVNNEIKSCCLGGEC